MTDKDIIINSLQKIERRLRANRLSNDVSYALALFLLFPLTLKVSDLFIGFAGTTIAVTVGLWFVAFAGYCIRLFRKQDTLAQAAASVDKRIASNDELRTAYWFIENPRPSDWVEVQIQRAARNAQKIDVDRLYPRAIPRTLLYSGAILVLVVVLNFIPTSLNHNWLALEAAPTTELSDADLNLEDIAAGLEEIAQDFQESEQLEETAENLLAKNLPGAAAELREVAGNLETISPEALREMQQSLDEASENSRPGLEDLARSLKEAADGLERRDQGEAEEALEEAALELEQLSEKIEAQLSRNASRQGPRIPGKSGQGAAESAAALEQTQQGAGWSGPLPQDQMVANNAPPGNAPMGLEPSGDPVPNPPRYGPPTSLKVQLEREKLESQIAELKEKDPEEASKEERSKLDYRNVESDLRPAQKDVLNQDRIPTKYRDLIRNYFQAIRPPG